MSLRRFATTGRVVQRLRVEYTALMSWWLHEIREIIADLEQRLAPGKPHRTTIFLSRTAGSVIQQWRNGTVKSSEFQRTRSGDFPGDRSEFWPTAKHDATTVHVVLPGSAMLVRRIWLPASAAQNLQAVVELQLERELPVPRERVQADWRIEARNRDGTKIEVAIGVVWRSEIERVLTAIGQWKFRVATISVDLGDHVTVFNFATRRNRGSVGTLTRVDRVLMMSSAIFLLAYIGVSGAQWLHERIVVQRALSNMTSRAAKIERTRAQLNERRKPMLALLGLMATPSSAEVLADLTNAVPRDSWLQQLDIRSFEDGSSQINLTASTPAATQLVSQLQQSPHLEKVELQSAATLGLGTTRDSAELSAMWRKTSTGVGVAVGAGSGAAAGVGSGAGTPGGKP
jgi:hypothetical protein